MLHTANLTNDVSEFIVGQLYTNDQIRFTLHVENLGGIRPAVDGRGSVKHIAVLTAVEDLSKTIHDNPYHDRIESDVLIYTAQGREGDQQLRGRNKRLIEQYSIPVPIFGFVNVGRQRYRFLGLLELLRHYQETQADSNRLLRRVWLFEFRIHSNPVTVPVEQASAICATLLMESRQQSGWSPEESSIVDDTNDPPSATQPRDPTEIERIRSSLLRLAPYSFEEFLRGVMEHSGFSQIAVTRKSGDGGIDLSGYTDDTNDFFAGTHVQVQAKRWRHAVGCIEINHFRGALSSTAKGIFVTTSHFTRPAISEARHPTKPCITLIDGVRLSTIVIRLHMEV